MLTKVKGYIKSNGIEVISDCTWHYWLFVIHIYWQNNTVTSESVKLDKSDHFKITFVANMTHLSLKCATPVSDYPENCHLTVKKLPNTCHFFQKNWQKLPFFQQMAILLKKMTIFVIFFKCQVFGNFLAFKRQVSEGSGPNMYDSSRGQMRDRRSDDLIMTRWRQG